MPHLRQDITTREWVIYAPERARRPEDMRDEALAKGGWTHDRPEYEAKCPFCPGQEEACTPGETLRYLDRHGDWLVRSCPNRYPALEPGAPPFRQGERFERQMPGVGNHEVIVESRLHNVTMALQSPEQVALIMRAWAERYADLVKRPETEHVILFKNHGSRGGTSLAHPHSQAVSLPVTPRSVRIRMEEAMRYHNDFGECVYCSMLWREKLDDSRIVVEGVSCSAFIPFAAVSPYLVWVVPHRHCGSPAEMDPLELEEFGSLLRDVLARLYHGLGDPDYNLVMRTASRDYLTVPFSHWFVVVVPRVTTPAGFEVGTGMSINSHLPEDDARYLRGIDIDR